MNWSSSSAIHGEVGVSCYHEYYTQTELTLPHETQYCMYTACFAVLKEARYEVSTHAARFAPTLYYSP